MIKNKKGVTLTQTTLVVIIISLFIFAILFVFLNELRVHTESQTDSKKCKLEVLKASEFSKYLDDKDFVYAKCPAKDLGTIDLSSNEDRAKKEMAVLMADEMVDCWDKFGEGKLNPLPGEYSKRKTHCYVCSQFKMPDNSFSSLVMQGPLNTYLSIDDKNRDFLEPGIIFKNNLPFYGIEKLSYKELWFDGWFSKAEDAIIDPWNLNLKQGKTYYLLNVFVVNKDLGGKDAGFWGTIMTAAFGFSNHDTYSKMAFIEPEKINDVCNTLEN